MKLSFPPSRGRVAQTCLLPSARQLPFSQSLFLALVLLLLAGISGCGKILDPGPPPSRVQLSPSLPEPTTAMQMDKQLIIALPLAGRDIDTDNIALLFNEREVKYLAGTRWTNTVPSLVQRTLIEALESSRALRGVADEGAGLAANAKLLCSVRQFSLRYADPSAPPTAVFSASFRMLNLATGEINDTRTIETTVPAGGTDTAALIRAMETALSKALAEATPWILQTLGRL